MQENSNEKNSDSEISLPWAKKLIIGFIILMFSFTVILPTILIYKSRKYGIVTKAKITQRQYGNLDGTEGQCYYYIVSTSYNDSLISRNNSFIDFRNYKVNQEVKIIVESEKSQSFDFYDNYVFLNQLNGLISSLAFTIFLYLGWKFRDKSDRENYGLI